MKNARVYELKGSLYLFKAKILKYHDCVAHKTIIEKHKLEQRPSTLNSNNPTYAGEPSINKDHPELIQASARKF